MHAMYSSSRSITLIFWHLQTASHIAHVFCLAWIKQRTAMVMEYSSMTFVPVGVVPIHFRILAGLLTEQSGGPSPVAWAGALLGFVET